MAIRVNDCAVTDHAVANNVIRLDSRSITETDVAFEYCIDIDEHVLAAGQLAANIHARRIGKTHALLHEFVDELQLAHPFRCSFLFLVFLAHFLYL